MGMSLPKPRTCKKCGSQLENHLRLDARFCGSTCRSAASQKRKRREERRKRPKPADFQALRTLLLEHAPPTAVGYALGRRETPDSPTCYFPPPGRKTKRSTGRFSDLGYFLLRPFELPRVPVAERYAVRFYDAAGRVLPIVDGLGNGVEVRIATHGVQFY